MKYFVTGATGFIGNRLIQRLSQEGHDVVAHCRSASKEYLLGYKGITICRTRLEDHEGLLPYLQGCDGIFHVAGLASAWHRDPQEYVRINVDITVGLLELARIAGIPAFIYTSSAAVTGPSNPGPVTEETVPKTALFTEYARSKALAEQRILDFSGTTVRRVLLEPTRVYGPGQLSESNAVTKAVLLYSKGKWRMLPGRGQGIGNYVYIDDVVDAHIRAMQYGRDGERYLLPVTSAVTLKKSM